MASEMRRNNDKNVAKEHPEPIVEASNWKASPEADEDGLTGACVGEGRCRQTSP